MTVRTVVGPFVRMSTARTRQVPTTVPRTLVPANLHFPAPDTMLRRSLPCEPRGIESPVAPAMRAAVSVRPRRTVSTFTRGPVLAVPDADCAVPGVEVVVAGDVVVVDVVDVDVVAGGTVGATVGAVVAPTVVVGATVVVVYTVGSEATLTGADRGVVSPVPN